MSTARILFVEDELILRKIAVVLLSAAGFEVVLAHDGLEGLATYLAQPEAFDLVVTDVYMPGLDGIELAQRILATRPAQRLLFVSASDDLDLPLVPGQVQVASKHYHDGRLEAAVRAVLSGEPVPESAMRH